MNSWQEDVHDFHGACNIPRADAVVMLTKERAKLRRDLLKEESKEMRKALMDKDIIGIIDGAVDTIVVVLGTMEEMGIDLDPFWKEIHKTNMAKAGGPVRADGKQLKPPDWKKPDLQTILDRILEEELDKHTAPE